MDSTSAADNIREDAVSKVLGKDKPGRVRGFGRGITANKLAYLQFRDPKIAEMKSEIEELKGMVQELAKKKVILFITFGQLVLRHLRFPLPFLRKVMLMLKHLRVVVDSKKESEYKYWIGLNQRMLLLVKENSALLNRSTKLVVYQLVLMQWLS